LVAFWQRGLGRTAAISFPLGGDFSQHVRAWSDYGNFNRTLVRWLLGPDLPAGVSLRTRVEGTELQINLLYALALEQKISQQPPRIEIAMQNDNGSPVVSSPTWQRIGPGRYDASVHLSANRYARGAVQIGDLALPFGPLVAGSNPEWTRNPRRLEELRALSHATGGEQRLDLSSVWRAPHASGTTSLRSYVLLVLLLVMLADFLETRIGRAALGRRA
jgi:hypothetical protein